MPRRSVAARRTRPSADATATERTDRPSRPAGRHSSMPRARRQTPRVSRPARTAPSGAIASARTAASGSPDPEPRPRRRVHRPFERPASEARSARPPAVAGPDDRPGRRPRQAPRPIRPREPAVPGAHHARAVRRRVDVVDDRPRTRGPSRWRPRGSSPSRGPRAPRSRRPCPRRASRRARAPRTPVRPWGPGRAARPRCGHRRSWRRRRDRGSASRVRGMPGRSLSDRWPRRRTPPSSPSHGSQVTPPSDDRKRPSGPEAQTTGSWSVLRATKSIPPSAGPGSVAEPTRVHVLPPSALRTTPPKPAPRTRVGSPAATEGRPHGSASLVDAGRIPRDAAIRGAPDPVRRRGEGLAGRGPCREAADHDPADLRVGLDPAARPARTSGRRRRSAGSRPSHRPRG